MRKTYLSKYDELCKGDYLMSPNREFKAVFQEDGNFVIYECPERPVWASDTEGSDAVRVSMHADCNLVMYNENGEPRWQTNSATGDRSFNMCCLYLTDEGKLVLDRDGYEIWSSAEDSREVIINGHV